MFFNNLQIIFANIFIREIFSLTTLQEFNPQVVTKSSLC